MTSQGETELEMVQRHVREGARRVERQIEIIANLHAAGRLTEEAEVLLQNFEETQRLHEEHLVRLSANAQS